MKVFIAGSATQDVFIHYKNPETLIFKSFRGTRSYLLLEKGSKIEVTDIVSQTGGGATNVAVAFKRLGFTPVPIIKIGNDQAGIFITEQLKNSGIGTRFVIVDHHHHTGISYIIPSFEGDRTIFAHRGANAYLHEQDIPLDELDSCQFVYLTSLSGTASQNLISIVQRAKKHNLPVAVNPGVSQLSAGSKTLEQALTYIDILILNSQEAQTFLSRINVARETERECPIEPTKLPELINSLACIENSNFDLKDFCREILSRGPSIVVVTNGAEGVYVAHQKSLHFCPSLPIQVINTLGAGDAFGSCFAASIFQKLDIQHAIMRGMLNSAAVIAQEGAKTGLLTAQELEEREHTFDMATIKTFLL